MKTPERTSAAAFPRQLGGHVMADSASLHWSGLYVRRYRFPYVVDRFLVPSTAEPLITCNVAGSAEFRQRDSGKAWITRQIRQGDLFVTRSRTPYEVSFSSPVGEKLEVIHTTSPWISTLPLWKRRIRSRLAQSRSLSSSGDPALAHLCLARGEMLASRAPGKSKRLADLTNLIATYLVEKYTGIGSEKPEFRGGLPIRQVRKIEDYVTEHLAEEMPVEKLAELVELSPFHFSRVLKESTGMSPLQFVTRERIAHAQRLIRETSRNLIEIALEVGYTSPSHFAQVFRRVVGVTPTEFRSAL